MSNPIVKKYAPFVVLFLIAIGALFVPNSTPFPDTSQYNAADITWILIATALVFLMTPGLAFFYGGMVHRKNIISTMIKSMAATGVVSILWIFVGYSLCFGESIGGFIGNPTTHLFFKDVLSGAPWSLAPTIPLTLFALFQLMFAVITPGLVVGAVAERIRFTAYTLFIALFSILVYAPIAHWSWHPEGFLFKMGALDFAGGTVVHISAGCAALAGAIILKRRKAHIENKEIPPANIPYVLIGTGLLWFGWFGFNAGSAFAANGQAIQAFLNTFLAAAAGGLVWGVVERIKDGHFTNLGVASGIVAGLVAITPGAGYVSGMSPIWIGAAAGLICAFAVHLKFKAGYDDALDVVGVHFVGGLVGSLLIGLFADPGFFGAEFEAGLLNGGGVGLLVEQLIANGVTIVFSFVMTTLILLALRATVGIRVSEEDELTGLDTSQHAETAYNAGEVTMGRG